MEVYYKLYFNSKSFEDKNEPDYLLIYAFKYEGSIKQVSLEIKKRGYLSQRILSKLIKNNSQELSNETIYLKIQDAKSLSSLAALFS